VDHLEEKIKGKITRILDELKAPHCEVKFTDFLELSREPLMKAQGYNPEYHAKIDTEKKIIEINTIKLGNNDFLHWKNWDNIISHEIGHLILNPPVVNVSNPEGPIGSAALGYQYGLFNIAQDMTIHNHIIPSKYTDFDLSNIKPWSKYSEANLQVKNRELRWGLRLGLVEKLPLWFAYGHYDKNREGKRIISEIDRVLQREQNIKSIALETERLVKPYSMGLDCRKTNLQGLVDNGFQFYRFWAASHKIW
jgi:hypothetical protein